MAKTDIDSSQLEVHLISAVGACEKPGEPQINNCCYEYCTLQHSEPLKSQGNCKLQCWCFLKGYASLRLVKGHESCKLQHWELLESCERFEFQFLHLLENGHMPNIGYLVMLTDCETNPPKRGARSCTVQNKSIKGLKKLRVLIFVHLFPDVEGPPPPPPPPNAPAVS